MFCDKCGVEISDDSRFCSKCGQRTQTPSGDTELVLEDTPATTARSRGRRSSGGVIAAWTLGLGTLGTMIWSVNQHYSAVEERAAASLAEAKNEARKAVDGVMKIDAAISVGVTKMNYFSLLAEAAAAVRAYEPRDSLGQTIKRRLELAVSDFKSAGTFWDNDRLRQEEWEAAGTHLDLATSQLAKYDSGTK